MVHGLRAYIRVPDSEVLPLLAQQLGQQRQRPLDVSIRLQRSFEMVAVFRGKGVVLWYGLKMNSRCILPPPFLSWWWWWWWCCCCCCSSFSSRTCSSFPPSSLGDCFFSGAVPTTTVAFAGGSSLPALLALFFMCFRFPFRFPLPPHPRCYFSLPHLHGLCTSVLLGAQKKHALPVLVKVKQDTEREVLDESVSQSH